jgi:hypothetical protein
MRFGLALGLASILAVSLAAQRPSGTPSRPAAPPRQPPAREATVPFKVGETLSYDVSWSSMLVAGTAQTTVKEKRPSFSSTAYYIVAEGRPLPMVQRLYSLYYKMDSLVDSFSLLSQRGSLYSEEGAERQMLATRFDRAARRAAFERQERPPDGPAERVQVPISPETQDGLATLYALRTRALKSGDRTTTPVADGGELYNVTMEVGPVEQIRVPAGTFGAWRLTGVITDADGQEIWKNIGVWISNDSNRVPVKLQAEIPVGHFVLALREMR